MKKVFIGSDHAGFEVKSFLLEHLAHKHQDFNVVDCGTLSSEKANYSTYAHNLSKALQNSEQSDFGILICGSGIGVSIVANRYAGIRAALIYNEKIAELSRQHNDANVACFGARFFSVNEIKDMVETFLSTPFLGGTHLERVQSIDNL
jgi:ribose 5-phosphate isomerase B